MQKYELNKEKSYLQGNKKERQIQVVEEESRTRRLLCRVRLFKRTNAKSTVCVCVCVCVCSVTSNSLQSHGLQPTRLLCLWNFPGKNTGVGIHFLLQGIFSTQGLNPCLFYLLHWQVSSLPLCQVNLFLDFAQGSTVLPWQSEQLEYAYGMLALPF